MSGQKHYYLHADLDAFFASVEQLDHPEYRGKPVIVGGLPEDRRSVVSTASYEARKYGVHSAMPTAKAYQLCPDGIYVRGRMERYSELSYRIMSIFKDFSPDVQQLSIDEAFIDLTGTEGLFGPPEQTAMKIKQRVKDETGLTVSIGLAPTKYLAKIASDMKKPDGFYEIKAGEEKDFMLSLPLKKVWGIGDKTYENLHKSGLFTTRDIYEKSLEALIFMYGQNTGSFLYNVVRGIEIINFDRKTKSHSISNETTFPYDVSDLYTAETCVLELCHSVMFRLLKEGGFSRTVMIKIRYEDFSTVSIQQSYSQSILTLDSLYLAAKELFERKYERGRGIRLLGVALENIEATEHNSQPSLFDDGTEKKQKVEKAILNLEKKHPEIKIHKARLLKITATVFFIFASLFLRPATALYAQENEITEYSDVDITGSYTGTMDGSVNMTFGLGNPFGISAPLPVFKQEVDLSAWIQINPYFYFSLDFLDEFKHNTYAFGYKGPGYLKEFKLSNRGITFPELYSSSLTGFSTGGGENEAPGIMLSYQDYKNNRWRADFMLRYDMTKSKSALFYGSNSIKENYIQLADFVHSQTFAIPSAVITQIKDVYVQSINGTVKDSKGIKYARLNPSEYLVSETQKTLVLSDEIKRYIKKDTVPYIVISFFEDSAAQTLLSATGSYSVPDSFAGKIQSYFTDQYDLSLYSDLSLQALTIQIDGSTGYIIQSPVSFSPYLCAGSYKVTNTQNTDYLIADRYSGAQNKSYSAVLMEDQGAFKQTQVIIKNNSFDSQNAAGTAETPQALFPQYRYPLADTCPELYLRQYCSNPLVLVARTSSPIKEYDIGKYAQESSVCVYRNGILEKGAKYDSDTGFVTLAYPAGEMDKIYITWNVESSDSSNGMITTAAGFLYNFTPNLNADLSFSGTYPYLLEKDYATISSQKNTFSALTAGLTWQNSLVKIQNAVSGAFENNNITDTLQVYVPEEEESVTGSIDDLEVNTPLCQTEFTLKNAKLWQADYLEILIKPGKNNVLQAQDVFLELGIRENGLYEKPPVWNISSLTDENVIIPLDPAKNSWQKIKIRITEEQRSKLNGGERARIKAEKGIFEPGDWAYTRQPLNIPQRMDWDNIYDNYTITAISYFDQADFSLYKKVCVDFALTKKAGLELLLQGSDNINAIKLAVKADALEAFVSPTAVNHILTVELNSGRVLIDQTVLSQADYELNINYGIAPCAQKLIIYPEQAGGSFCFNSLYYKDGISVFSGKEVFTFELGNPQQKQDGWLYAYTDAGLSSVTNQGKINSQYINSNIKGSYTLADINFYADAGAAVNPNIKPEQVLQTAGHSITTQKTLLQFLDFGEIYRYNKASTQAEKKDYIKLSLPPFTDAFKLSTGAETWAQYSQTERSQKYSLDFSSEISAGKIKIIPYADFMTLQEKTLSLTESTDKFADEYFTAWYEISKLQFCDNNPWQQKSIALNTKLTTELPFAKLKPSVAYQLNSKHNSRTTLLDLEENLFKLALPFGTNSNAFEFDALYKTAYKYKNKTAQLNFTVNPFYAVFQNNMNDAAGYYQYDFLWKRRLYNNSKDIFIPTSAAFSFNNNQIFTDKDKSNMYYLKAGLERNFLYIFENGMQQEYNGSLTVTYSFANEKPDVPVYSIADTQKVIFYMANSNIVNIQTEMSLDNFLNWKFNITSSWERTSTKSLLQSLTTAVYPKALEWALKTKIKDSISIKLLQQDKKNKQSYGYMRTSEMNFKEHYSVSSGAGITFGYEQDKTLSLAVNYTLGLKIVF